MQKFGVSPIEMISSIKQHHGLLFTLTKREVIGRYRGSFMGIFWSFLTPLLMLSVYTFVFGEVFNARWHRESDSQGQFALMLFAGLILFNVFAECVNRMPSIIIANVNYVKKVVFPLELLPLTVVCSSLFHCFVSLVVWIAAYIIMFGVPHITVLLMPLIVMPLVLMIIGISWLLSALGVFVRDVGQLVGLLTTAMMFLSPIFFPISALPTAYQKIVHLNPLTLPIEQLREVLFFGELPDWYMLGWYTLAAIFTAFIGFAFFQKTRKGFADVL